MSKNAKHRVETHYLAKIGAGAAAAGCASVLAMGMPMAAMAAPGDPVTPKSDSSSTQPVTPAPEDPGTTPVTPDPVTPGEVTPAEPVQPAEPVKPAEPVQPAEPVKPAEPVQPAEPVKPAEPVQPAEPVKPAEPVQPAEPVKPAEPVVPAHPSVPVVVPQIPVTPSSSGLGLPSFRVVPLTPVGPKSKASLPEDIVLRPSVTAPAPLVAGVSEAAPKTPGKAVYGRAGKAGVASKSGKAGIASTAGKQDVVPELAQTGSVAETAAVWSAGFMAVGVVLMLRARRLTKGE